VRHKRLAEIIDLAKNQQFSMRLEFLVRPLLKVGEGF